MAGYPRLMAQIGAHLEGPQPSKAVLKIKPMLGGTSGFGTLATMAKS